MYTVTALVNLTNQMHGVESYLWS